MLQPKNISEYVAQYVIKHNKYRDEELDILYKVLEDFDINKCFDCEKYYLKTGHCEVCDKYYCGCCGYIEHIKTWNLSGTWMCAICVLNQCHNCSHDAIIGCKYCKIPSCNHCFDQHSHCK